MRRSFPLALCSLLFSASLTFAQAVTSGTGAINGKVTDASETLPLIAPVPDVTAWAKVRDAEKRSKHKASGNERRMGTLQE